MDGKKFGVVIGLKVVFVGLGLSAESRMPNLRSTVALNEIW